MIYQKMLNLMKIQSQLASNNFTMSVGQITAYDPSNYLAQVQLFAADEDENAIQTGWLPIGSQWIGNSWGLFTPPNIGDVCEVHYQEGSIQNGYVGLRYFGFGATNLPVPSGEFWLVHESGSFIKLTNDGKINLNGNVEIDMTSPTLNINSSTVVNVNSPSINLGPTGGTFEYLINGLAQAIYNGHTHNQQGGGVTDVPNQLWSASEITTHVKAT